MYVFLICPHKMICLLVVWVSAVCVMEHVLLTNVGKKLWQANWQPFIKRLCHQICCYSHITKMIIAVI